MTSEETAVALEGCGHETGSLKHRMDAAERGQEALGGLAAPVKVIAAELKNQSAAVIAFFPGKAGL